MVTYSPKEKQILSLHQQDLSYARIASKCNVPDWAAITLERYKRIRARTTTAEENMSDNTSKQIDETT